MVLGEMAEWSKAQHWKCCIGATLSRVRIPLSPLYIRNKLPARFVELQVEQFGEVAERSKAQHWKCCIGATLSRVRIPPSPLD